MNPSAQLMTEAVQHHRAGRLADAERIYRQVLQSEPAHPSAHYFLGLLAHQVGKHEHAVTLIEQAVRLNPNEAAYWVILGNSYHALGKLEQAERCQRRAIQVNPKLPQAHSTLAAILKERGAVEPAMESLREALRQGAPAHETLNNLGNWLAALGRLDEARTTLEQSVQAAPNMPQAHWNLSLIYLMQGDLPRGFAEQEWRLRHPASGARQFAQPMWDGSPLSGKSILLHSEQGFGDAIQFVRYAPLIPPDGGRIIVECQPELTRLLAAVAGISQVVAAGNPLPPFDVQAPLLSLPYLFKTTQQTIPAAIPYLRTDPSLVEQWRERISTKPGIRNIGLVWAGRPTHRNDPNRSMRLDDLAPLSAVPNVCWFSLQIGPAASQSRPQGMDLIDLTLDIHDFADTAAVLANLDLLISVDTAAVHVAGALGRPVWILLPYVLPDWRWLMRGETTAWYPTARLFRQASAGDWKSVLHQVTNALTK